MRGGGWGGRTQDLEVAGSNLSQVRLVSDFQNSSNEVSLTVQTMQMLGHELLTDDS